MEQAINTANTMNTTGLQEDRIIVFILMLFLAMAIMFAVHLSAKIVINRFSIKSRKKKVLKKFKKLTDENPDGKIIVLSSDKDGIPTLIEASTKYEFL